MENDVTQA